MSRSDEDARSSLVFIEFGSMEVKGDVGQTILAEGWWQQPDHSEAEERSKEMETHI